MSGGSGNTYFDIFDNDPDALPEPPGSAEANRPSMFTGLRPGDSVYNHPGEPAKSAEQPEVDPDGGFSPDESFLKFQKRAKGLPFGVDQAPKIDPDPPGARKPTEGDTASKFAGALRDRGGSDDNRSRHLFGKFDD